jgi:hypothetical protein
LGDTDAFEYQIIIEYDEFEEIDRICKVLDENGVEYVLYKVMRPAEVILDEQEQQTNN